PQVRQWLFDNQDKYWIKDSVDAVNILWVDIPFTEGISNWPEAVTSKLIELIYAEPSIGYLCTLPYSANSHRIRTDQAIEKDEMYCKTRRECTWRTRYLVY